MEDMGKTTKTKALQSQSTRKLYKKCMKYTVSAFLLFHRINLIPVTGLAAGKQSYQYNDTKDFDWMTLRNNVSAKDMA